MSSIDRAFIRAYAKDNAPAAPRKESPAAPPTPAYPTTVVAPERYRVEPNLAPWSLSPVAMSPVLESTPLPIEPYPQISIQSAAVPAEPSLASLTENFWNTPVERTSPATPPKNADAKRLSGLKRSPRVRLALKKKEASTDAMNAPAERPTNAVAEAPVTQPSLELQLDTIANCISWLDHATLERRELVGVNATSLYTNCQLESDVLLAMSPPAMEVVDCYDVPLLPPTTPSPTKSRHPETIPSQPSAAQPTNLTETKVSPATTNVVIEPEVSTPEIEIKITQRLSGPTNAWDWDAPLVERPFVSDAGSPLSVAANDPPKMPAEEELELTMAPAEETSLTSTKESLEEVAATVGSTVTEIPFAEPSPPTTDSMATMEKPAEPLPEVLWEVDQYLYPAMSERLLESYTYFQQAGDKLKQAAATGLKTLAITGVERNEGRTTLAICLARSAAKAGLRVGLLDADFESPQLADQLGLELDGGWERVLAGQATLGEIAIRSLADRVLMIPLSPGSAENVDARQVGAVLKQAASMVDLLIVDCGPWSEASVCFAGGPLFEAAIVVRDCRRFSLDEAHQVAKHLQQTGLDAVGIAENFSAAQK